MEEFCKALVSINGFHLNGDYKNLGVTDFHYRPFTLEANFGFNDALQELMIKDRRGYVELFPALPDAWKDISFKLAIYGGMVVECKLKDKKVEFLSINSKKERTVTIKSAVFDEDLHCELKKGKNVLINKKVNK